MSDKIDFIDSSVIVPESSTVGVFTTIREKSRIGERTSIGSYVCISENVSIGDDCTIGGHGYYLLKCGNRK